MAVPPPETRSAWLAAPVPNVMAVVGWASVTAVSLAAGTSATAPVVNRSTRRVVHWVAVTVVPGVAAGG